MCTYVGMLTKKYDYSTFTLKFVILYYNHRYFDFV